MIASFFTGLVASVASAWLFRIGYYEIGAAMAFTSVTCLILTHRS
jgi:hypothetical protein